MEKILGYVYLLLVIPPCGMAVLYFFRMIFDFLVAIADKDLSREKEIALSMAVGGIASMLFIPYFKDEIYIGLLVDAVVSSFCYYLLTKTVK